MDRALAARIRSVDGIRIGEEKPLALRFPGADPDRIIFFPPSQGVYSSLEAILRLNIG